MQFTDRYPEIRRLKSNKLVYRKTRYPVPSKIVQIIETLRVPKDYKTLWVSENPENDFLQAVALDSKNRKQYFYSPEWIEKQNKLKMQRMYTFALLLPQMDKAIERDTHREPRNGVHGPFSKERVIAFMLRIIQLTNIRIGNKKYYDKYKSHGLCTLAKDQVRVHGKTIRINFIGKHNQEHDIIIDDPSVVEFLRRLKRCDPTDPWLFKFQSTVDQKFYRVSAQMVNDYLHTIDPHKTITCKDFRTLNANVYFLKILRAKPIPTPCTPTSLSQNVKETIHEVCSRLNNTANVCKKSYIMDVIIKLYLENPRFVAQTYILDMLKLACKKSAKK